jgi:hypothetical protein
MLKEKLRHYLSWQRLLALTGLAFLICLSLYSPINAQAVSEGFQSEGNVQRGMIVRIKKEDSRKVMALTQETADQMHGVVVNSSDAPVTLSDDGQKVFVATTGHYNLLVSSQAGSIAPGDYVTISSLAGVGMKAGSKDTYVVGRALSAFDGVNNVSSTNELTDSAGGKKKVNLGQIQVDITVARNPLLKGEDPNVPEFLRKATETIAGKPVNAVRIYIAILVFCISAFVSGSLLYGGIKSALISVGRNPLARKRIIRTMFQVVMSGLIVFTIGLFGVYLILKI